MRHYQIQRWVFWFVLVAVFFFGAIIGSSGNNTRPKPPLNASTYEALIDLDNQLFLVWAGQCRNLQDLFWDLSKADLSTLPMHLLKQEGVNAQIKTIRIKRDQLLRKLGYHIPE